MQSLHPGTRPPHPAAAMNGAPKPPQQHSGSSLASLELRNSIYQTTSKASRAVTPAEANALMNGVSSKGNMSYQCDTCGTDCTALRYHSLKVKDFELCGPCYLDGRFPSTMFSGDFVRLVSSPPGVSHGGADDDWTDQEVLMLLEGIEMFDDDWSSIEDHVGTRTAQQCIRKFLSLPIEDPYIAAEGDVGPLRFGRIPFEQADNPVMSVVAFLSGVVGSGVAAEAAKAAMHALTDGVSREGVEDAVGGGGESGDKKDAAGDSAMNEDVPDSSTTANSQTQNGSPPNTEEAEGAPADAAKATTSQPKLPHSQVVRAAQLALKSSAKAAQNLADSEDVHIRSTLASLIKLTLTKLELKMSQFEELEEVLEEERKGLESARIALVSERVNLKRMLDGVRSELAKNGQTSIPPTNLGTTGQGTIAAEVPSNTALDGDAGPRNDGEFAQLG